ncbi:hypothetical protein [Jeongeupia chitinilytica]|uniref:hypothetical protein n=1 Tax=Jeongeupia chitinilytica TaxID=1041641 RepID=UPI00167A1F49|nr:hypothetical protein [Jeongeupia chitinilytica]
MFQKISIQRLSVGSVFKLLAIGVVFSFIPFSVLMGVFAFFGASTVHWNGQSLTGITGLLASPFVGLFVAFLFTAFVGAMCVFGLWLYSKFMPIELAFKEPKA